VIFSGLAYAQETLEGERRAICGERCAHLADRIAMRSGHVASSLTLGGRLVKSHRPRVRSCGWRGAAAELARMEFARSTGKTRGRADVSGRFNAPLSALAEPLPAEFQGHGVSKSAVSERFVVGTSNKLAALMKRKLSGLKLLAVMIDGVDFAEHMVLAAIGIDSDGKKQVLGLRARRSDRERCRLQGVAGRPD
jgi:putative transposase